MLGASWGESSNRNSNHVWWNLEQRFRYQAQISRRKLHTWIKLLSSLMQWQAYRQHKGSVAFPFSQNDVDPSFWREAQVEHFQVASRAATAAGSWYQRLALFDWRRTLNDVGSSNFFHSRLVVSSNFTVVNLYFRFPLEWLLLCCRNISAVSSWSTVDLNVWIGSWMYESQVDPGSRIPW